MVKKLVFLILSAFTTISYGQTITNSPYSRFGLGEMQFQGFADQRGLGQLGFAQRDALNISLLNPASYSALKMTNFRFGARSGFGEIKQGDQVLDVNSASLAYLVLGFQINKQKDWGVVFGMLPYSSVNYNIQFNNTDTSIGDVNNSINGSGGLTRLFLGTGKEFGDYFSVGVQGSFLFGQKRAERITDFPDASPFLDFKESTTDFVRGASVEAGAQAYFPGKFIRKTSIAGTDSTKTSTRRDTTFIRHNFGLNYSLSTNLDVKRDQFSRTILIRGTQEYTRDTVQFDGGIGGKYTLPSSIGFGYMLNESNQKWRLGVDYTMTLWTEYESSFGSQKLKDEHQVSLGGAFRPSLDFNSKKNRLFKNTEYRIGGFYRTGYLELENNTISEYGISLGFGIPLKIRTVNEDFRFQTVISSLNVSIEYVKRGTLNNNLILEDYLNFGFGVSLNDKWFNKRKIQ